MAQENKILYSIDFDVNKKKIEQLKKSLQDVKKMSLAEISAQTGITDIDKLKQSLKDAKAAANVAEKAIAQAFNPKLNTVNIEKFKAALKDTGGLKGLRTELQKIGPTGTRTFSQIESQVFKMGQTVKQTHSTLDKMYTTLTNSIKWGLSSTIINGFSNTIQQAWGYAKSLDTSLNDIRIVTGKSADEMARFAEKANSVAQELGKSTTDYTKAALIYAQQGLNDKEVEARTQVTLKTANVTGQSAEDVSEQLTAVWNGYKVSAEQAEVYVDRLAAVAATTASNLNELSTGMSKVASAAAAMGVGEDQLAAQLSTIISVTKQAPQSVGTALRTVYARITDIKAGVEEDGTTLGQYSGKMAQMGINVLDLNGNLRDMGTVMEEIGAKWGDMSREQQVYLAQTMAGQRQYNNLLALFDNFDKYNSALETAQDAAGTLQQQQDIYMESTAAHLETLRAGVENVYDSLIDTNSIKPLLDMFTGLTNMIAGFVDTLGGGVGVLSMLGAIGLNVFGNKIANSLQVTISNMGLAKAQAIELTEKIKGLQEVQNDTSRPQEERDWAAYQQSLLEKKRDFKDLIPSDVLEKAQELNNQIKDINATFRAMDEIRDKGIENRLEGLNATDLLEDENKSVYENYQNDSTGEFREQVDAELESIQQKFSNFRNNMEKMKNEIANIMPEDIKNADKIKKDIDELNKKIANLGTKKSTKKNKRKIKELQEEVKGLQDQLDQGKGKVDKFIQSLENMKGEGVLNKEQQEAVEKLKNDLSKLGTEGGPSIESIKKQFLNLQSIFGASSKQVQEFLKLLHMSPEEIEKLKAKLEQLKQQKGSVDESMKQSISVKRFTDLAGGITSVVAAFNQLKSIGNVWGSNASTGEKVLKTITLMATALPMLISGATKANAAFKGLTIQGKALTLENIKLIAAQSGHSVALTALRGAATAAATAVKDLWASLGPIGAIVLAATAIASIAFAIGEAEKAKKQARIEANKSLLEEQKAEAEQINKQQQLYKAISAINDKYQEGNITRAELKSEIQKLCDQYGLEQEQIDKLTDKYGNLTQAMKAAQLQAANQALNNANEQAETAMNIARDTQTAQGDNFVFRQGYYDNTNKDVKAIAEKYGLREQGGRWVLDKIQIGTDDAGNAIYKEADGSKEWAALQAETIKTVMAQIKKLDNYSDIRKTDGLISSMETWYHWEQNTAGGKDIDAGVAAAKEQASKIAALSVDFTDVSDLDSYNDKLEQAVKSFKENNVQLASIMSDEDIRTSIRENIRKDSSQSYSLYDRQAEKIHKLEEQFGQTIDSETLKEIENLDQAHLDKFLELKPETIDGWKQVNQYVKDTSEINLENLTKTNIDAATDKFQKYADILEKVRNGKKIDSKTFETLDPEMQKMFAHGVGGYSFVGNRKDFEKLGQQLQSSDFSTINKQNENDLTIANKLLEYSNKNGGQVEDIIKKKQEDIIKKKQNDKTRMLKEDSITNYGDFIYSEKDATGKTDLTYFNKLDSHQQADTARANGETLVKFAEQFKEGGKYADVEIDSDLKNTLLGFKTHPQDFHGSEDWTNYYLQSNDLLYKLAQEMQKIELPSKEEEQKAMLQILQNSQQYFNGESTANINKLKTALEKGKLSQAQDKELTELYDKIDFSKEFNSDALGDRIKELKEESIEAGNAMYDALFPTDTDLKETDIYNLQQTIQDLADSSDELHDGLKSNARTAKALSEQILRFNDGLMDAAKNISTWKTQLESGALTSVTAIRDAYSDMLNLDGESLSETFLRSTENLDLMNIALTGTEEEAKAAFDRLKELAQQDMLFQIGIDNNTYQESTEALRNLVNDSQIGDSLNDALIEPFFNMLVQAGATAGQIKDIFEGMDIRIQFSVDENGNPLKYQSGSATKSGDTDFLWKQRSQELEKQAKALKKQQQAQVDLKKATQDQRDLYHDINIELDEINRKLKNAQKEQKKLYGKDLIKGLDKQQQLLNQEIQTLKTKQAIQKSDKQYQQQQLASKGVTFGADGNISNYMSVMTAAQNKVDSLTNQYNTLANQYNASTDIDTKENLKQQMDEINKTLSLANTDLNDLKTGISNYDKLIKDMGSVEDQIQEQLDALIESNVEKFNLKAKLTLELGQAKRQWEDFKRNVLERDSVLYTNVFTKTEKDTNQHLAKAESYYTSGEMSANTEKLYRAMNAAKNIRKNGKDQLYGDNMALAMEDAKTASEQLQKELQGVAEQLDAIDQAYLDTIDNIQQMYSKQKQAYQKYGEQLSHDLDLIKLVYGQKNYKAMDKYYDKIHKNNVNNLDFLKKTNDENYRQWQEAEKRAEQYAKQNGADAEKTKQAAQDAKRFKEAYLNGVSDINSAITQSIQNLKDQYSNAIAEIFDNMEKEMTNGKSFEYLDTQWDLMKKKANLYLDTVNSAFAVKNTEYLYNQALNDTKGLRSQQQLKKVMNEQLTILKQKDKLTQYDVDRAQKVLGIEKARIALEQARNNKTQMRLKRDSQGNYSYQYVADQDNIGQAENNLAKAENDLYNFDKENYEKNLEQAYNATKEFQNKLSELYDEFNANYQNPEKQAEIMQQIKMVQKEYTDYINNLSQESMYQQQNMIDSGFESYKLSLGDAGQAFAEMTEEQKRNWMEQEGFVPTFNSGVQEMIEKFSTNEDSLENIVATAIDRLQGKNEEYQGKIHQLEESAGIDLAAVANGYDEIAIKIGGKDGQGGLIKNNDDLLDRMKDEYDTMEDLRGRGQELRKKYEEVTKQAELAVEQFQQMWTEQQKQAIQAAAGAVNQVADAYATLTTNLKDYQRQQTGGAAAGNTGVGLPAGETTPQPQVDYFSAGLRALYDAKILNDTSWYNGQLHYGIDQVLNFLNVSGLESDASNNEVLKVFKGDINFYKHFVEEWNKRYEQPNRIHSQRFDTGGYTGDWSSTQGKLAILHQKELVLNKQDTANLLDTIQALRDIYTMNTIQSQITSMLESLNEQAKIQKERVETLKQQKSLQQQVSISASFPGVTNKNEIEAAFNELINKATQATLKNKK